MIGNIYITGFMGAGKSTVGCLLAGLLGRSFVDLDQVIEKRLAMPIAEVFQAYGEDAFRQAEHRELKRVSRVQRQVVACGGGLVESEANRDLMRETGWVVNLAAGLETCRMHLTAGQTDTRPLWTDATELAERFARREIFYDDCDLKQQVGDFGAEQLAREVAGRAIPRDEFILDLGGEPCLVGGSWYGPEMVARQAGDRRVVLLTDRNVAELRLEAYRRLLPDPLVVVVPPGERTKSLAGAGRVYQAMVDGGIRRSDLLVALGGGVITDLGALVAATYMRGMRFILASTTTLGCVDAAVGGKAAVNLGQVKNLVGAFTRPEAVALDFGAFTTLQRRHRLEGLVEAYKTGLVAAPRLHGLIKEQMKPLLAGDVPLMAQVAVQSARTKAQVVGEDFRESGRRKILNLGHTYGHAVEGYNRYRVSHGRSVATGIMAAAMISANRGLLPLDAARAIVEDMAPLAPAMKAWPDAAEAWKIMRIDKKNQTEGQAFVLLEGLGRPLCVDDLVVSELEAALAGLKEL